VPAQGQRPVYEFGPWEIDLMRRVLRALSAGPRLSGFLTHFDALHMQRAPGNFTPDRANLNNNGIVASRQMDGQCNRLIRFMV
jgi:hypothetical protein